MTTRAGLAGLGAGILASTLLVYPLYFAWPGFLIQGWPESSPLITVVLAAAAVILVAAGGSLAARWSGPALAWQRLSLGALAGGLAAVVVFCSLGAAAGGTVGLGAGLASLASHAAPGQFVGDVMLQSVVGTQQVFWILLVGGLLLGVLGSLRLGRAVPQQGGTPARNDPQMALNATITALPSAAFALILLVGLFAALLDNLGQAGLALSHPVQDILAWPLATALLLYLAAQLALMLVVPHEARRSAHRCGIDEVKMAAYVGIFTPLALVAALGTLNLRLVFIPVVFACLLTSLGMVVRQVVVLYAGILPRRAQMAAPRDRLEAAFFGTIAESRWQSLIVLCLGCGMMMAVPAYVVVAATLINIAFVPVSAGPPLTSLAGGSALTPAELVPRLYWLQAVAGLGSSMAAALALTVLYLFYSRLGRVFRRLRQPNA